MGRSELASDGSEFTVPTAWRRRLHPRRGGIPRSAGPLAKDAEQVVERRLGESAGWIECALDNPASEQYLVEAARAHRSGGPNPLGAAVLAALTETWGADDRPFTDAWVRAFGLPFAAEAVVELVSMYVEWNYDGATRHDPSVRAVHGSHFPLADARRPAADRVRALLAATDEQTYRDTVAALAGCRSGAQRKIVVSYLVPTETAWVTECAELPGIAELDNSGLLTLLLCSLGSPDQLERLNLRTGPGWPTWSPDLIGTLAEGVGPAFAPLLGMELDELYVDTATVKLVATSLSLLPSDEALGILLAHPDDKYAKAALLDAARRYPLRALRMLAGASQGTSGIASLARQLLVGHVSAHRELVEAALPSLEEAVAAVVAPLAEQGEPVAEAPIDTLPALLVSPPWVRERTPVEAPVVTGLTAPAEQASGWLPGEREEWAAVETLLSADPLEIALPAVMPVLGAWADPLVLPRPVLREDGGALPVESVRQVLTMLALSKPGAVYAGVAVVREVCDPASLAEFGWALFECWRLAGMPANGSWALHALGLFGDDGTVRRLDPVLRAWPGQSAHHRAVQGLEVLAAIGTDVALLHLHGVAQRVKFKALKTRAQQMIAEVAAGLGLTDEQLADRLVPDLGLDAGGSTVIDYGARRFTVGFDEQLRPYVLDADGKRRKDLPAPGVRDDAELAPAERKRFTTLKKDVRTTAADQLRRLEAAMVTRRSWTAMEFHGLFVQHRLLWHLVRGLVWLGESEGAVTAFRVTESRTLADVAGEALALPEGASVRLAHPLLLDDALGAWVQLFADLGIVQPFPQLGRPVHRLTEEEAGSARLTRFEGVTVPTGKVLGLQRRGWERGEPQDGGVERWISRRLGPERYLVVGLEEGIAVGMVDLMPEQTLTAIWLDSRPGDHYWRSRESPLRLGELDPLTASELLADLTELTAG